MITNQIIFTIIKKLHIDPKDFFDDSPSCFLIFRNLSESAKNTIVRMINMPSDTEFDSADLRNYDISLKSGDNLIIESDNILLVIMKILEKQDEKGNKVKLNAKFVKTMKEILKNGLKNNFEMKFHRKPNSYKTSLEKGINRFYRFINENIFKKENMSYQKDYINDYINEFLLKQNFLCLDDKRKLKLTSFTKSFLPHKTEYLVRNLFMKFLLFSMENNEKKTKFIKLLFFLSTVEVGAKFEKIPEIYYDETFEKYIDFMNQSGYIITKEDKKTKLKKYCCTPLIQCLFEENELTKNYSLIKYNNINAERFLFIETNLKFYAYLPNDIKTKDPNNIITNKYNITTSVNSSGNLPTLSRADSMVSNYKPGEEKNDDEKNLFNINLLKHLFSIEIVLPNMLIGYITRESLVNIFKDIKSENLLEFLSDHMSVLSDDTTIVKGKKYFLNESVVNQILVIESEKNSVQTLKAVICLESFESDEQFKYYIKRMVDNKIEIKYKNDDKKIIVVLNNEINNKKISLIENEYKKKKLSYQDD